MSNSLHHEVEPASTGSIVDHIEHLEDLPVLRGSNGAHLARHYLATCLCAVAGESHYNTRLSTKYDGSFSIIAGYDPADGIFFVAKKSIFNKVPVYYKAPEDIIGSGLSDDLGIKLLWALRFLPDVIEDGIFQGDFLYDFNSPGINQGKPEFQPNTLLYVPRFRELRDQVTSSFIGIAWHTQYEGTIGNLNVCSKYPMPKSNDNVLSVDCTWIADPAGNAPDLMDDATYWKWIDYMYGLDKEIDKLEHHLDSLATHKEFPKLFKQYQNACAKGNLLGFGQWAGDYFKKERDLRKTVRGKQAVDDRMSQIGELIRVHKLNTVMVLINNIEFMKHYMIKELDKRSAEFKVYYVTKVGTRHETGHEGYVVSHSDGKEPVKIVDRNQFSYLNFSSDIQHGWER